jgi:WD40 repeat protein
MDTAGYRCLYRGHSSWVSTLDWSPDSRHIVSGSGDTTAQVWHALTGETLVIYRGHSESVDAVAWSPDGASIASAGQDKTVQVWDAVSGESMLTYTGHSAWIRRGLAWSPDGTRIASGAWDRTVQVWDAHTGQRLLTYEGHQSIVYAVAWSPDGVYIASCAGWPDGGVQVWDARTGQRVLTYLGHDNLFQMKDASTGELLQAYRRREASVRSVAWSPDGRRIASAGLFTQPRVWEAATGKDLVTYEGGEGPVVWSPDGKYLLAPERGRVMIWNARTGEAVSVYPHGRLQTVKAVAWSPDGRYIASSGDDQTVKVWEVKVRE